MRLDCPRHAANVDDRCGAPTMRRKGYLAGRRVNLGIGDGSLVSSLDEANASRRGVIPQLASLQISRHSSEVEIVTSERNATSAGSYIDAGGVHTYYEIQGAGEPLVLLHGGFTTIETWGAQTPALAERYQVYLPERRGHGRTPDVPGPTGYEIMAQDTIAFMDALGISSAHLVGWSDGGNVGLEVALARPDLVRKLVFMGAVANFDGYAPALRAQALNLTPESLPPMLREAYEAISPDGPGHFPVVFDKLAAVWKTEPHHQLADLEQVSAPTLVLLGDDDVISIEHAAALQRAIPVAQVAVVPGTDHALLFEKPELVNRLILDFLADEQVPKMFAQPHDQAEH